MQHTGLEICRKALANFLEQKRRKFPRFYFVSEVDLLDILSNGTNPASILKHVPKVLLATRSLDLQEPDPETARRAAEQEEDEGGSEDSRPKALSCTANVGVETMRFEAPIPLVGKVEEYLSALLAG